VGVPSTGQLRATNSSLGERQRAPIIFSCVSVSPPFWSNLCVSTETIPYQNPQTPWFQLCIPSLKPLPFWNREWTTQTTPRYCQGAVRTNWMKPRRGESFSWYMLLQMSARIVYKMFSARCFVEIAYMLQAVGKGRNRLRAIPHVPNWLRRLLHFR